MEAAIKAAWANPNAEAAAVPRAGEVPTVEEFITYTVKKVKDEKE